MTTKKQSSLVSAMLNGSTKTFNGCATNPTSLGACVDLFFLAGASRTMPEKNIISVFSKAYAEDPNTAMKLLFWARDIRGGAGERRFFQVVTKWLQEMHPESLNKNIKYVPEYGRWKDIFEFDERIIVPLIIEGLANDNTKGLVSKWLPRQGKLANSIRKALKLTPKEYRKLVVSLSNTVEQKMCAKEFGSINYEQVPSVAMNQYRKAFFKNDESRFKMYIDAVTKGEKKINASALYPYDLLVALKEGGNAKAIDAQWKALPDFIGDNEENFLVMADVSESMLSYRGSIKTKVTPMDVSVSLAIYLSERSKGIFKDVFMTFTSSPTLQLLKGSLSDRVRQVRGPIGYDTNLELAFKTVLNQAIKNNVPVEDMPSKILIISDMEFNSNHCIRKPNSTAMDMIIQSYKQAGYECPEIVFWNVNGREQNVPAKADMANVGLVSGLGPAIITSVLSGKITTPKDLMMKTVNSERYAQITA